MRHFAAERVRKGQPMTGVLVVHKRFAVGGAGIGILVNELELIAGASEAAEWDGVVQFIPFLFS